MANTKEYKIQINGLTESINAVDSLNKQLDALKQKIDALSNKTVNVGAKASTSSSSGGKSTSEEAAVQREINKLKAEGEKLDAKIVAAQDEIYKKVDATKQLYKETIADQKAIAAEERLIANTYSNTMQGMKDHLADLKASINATDLGDSDKIKKMTQEANELTQKLKEMEEAYGTFGRNVGNYQSAFEGLNKVSVSIGGVVKEFDNLKQATKAIRDEMGKLEFNGQQDTKMYKQLENELGKVTKAQLRLNSAMNDAKSSSKAMDDILDTMESFTAIGQVGQGFSTLFGLDNTELEQQIAKLVALQNVLKGIEKLRQQLNTKEGIGKWFSKGSDAVDNFVMKLTGAQKRMGMLVKETRTASIAVQTLSTSLKALGGVAFAGAFMALSGGISAAMEDLKKWINGDYKAGTATDLLVSSVDALNKEFDIIKRQNLNDLLTGLITQEEYAKRQTDLLITEISELTDKAIELKNGVPLHIIGGIEIDEAKEKFIELAKEIDKYENFTSKFKQWAAEWFSGPIAGINKTKKEFQDLGSTIAEDLFDRMTNLNYNASVEIQKFGNVTEKTAGEIKDLAKELQSSQVTNSLLTQIDKFSKEGQYYVKQINAIKDSFIDLAESIGPVDVSLNLERTEQAKIDAMPDGIKKQRAQIEFNRKKDIADAKGDEELKKALNEKYNREILNAEKSFGKEMAAAYADLENLRIEIMEEGWEKEKARLLQERDEKIRAVVESEKLVGARKQAIIALYNKKIEDAEKEFAAERLKIYEDLANDIQSVNKETFGMEVENALQKTENKYNESLRNAGKAITQNNYKNLEQMKEYYSNVLKAAQEQARKEEAIRQENLDKEYEYEKKEEELRHDRLIRNNGEYAQQLKQGKITKEQYDKLIEDENDAHTARMNAIDKKYAADTVALTQETLDKKEKAYSDYYSNVIAQVRKGQDDIVKQMNKAVVTDTDKKGVGYGFNVINYKATKANYAKLISEEETAISKIQEEREKLYDDKDNLGGEFFKQRLEELDAAEEAALATLKDLKEKSKGAFPDFLNSIMVYVKEVMNSFNTIMQAVWDAEDAGFDKEQEELDKYNEMLEEKLDKQAEIYEEHKSKVESIEDELATSRGDRRQHLIDQLNAEMEAERAAAAEKKKIEKEQAEAEKKQEELDKKRKKAEYNRQILQAIVNGAMAVTMAAINNWPIPAVPMMALAASTTAAQVAIMKANKPYASGGQLDGGVAVGNRHRDGGIKVLGGRAEIEGGEFITNRISTQMNAPLLEFINSKKKRIDVSDLLEFYSSGSVKKNISSVRTRFADGGYIPTLPDSLDVRDQLQNVIINQDNRPIYVSVVDINNKQADVRRVQTLAGLGE